VKKLRQVFTPRQHNVVGSFHVEDEFAVLIFDNDGHAFPGRVKLKHVKQFISFILTIFF